MGHTLYPVLPHPGHLELRGAWAYPSPTRPLCFLIFFMGQLLSYRFPEPEKLKWIFCGATHGAAGLSVPCASVCCGQKKAW
jgi:hypothetical protein